MKHLFVCILLLSVIVAAQQPKSAKTKEPQKPKTSSLKTVEEKMSYLSGFDLGSKVSANVKANNFPISVESFITGMKEAFAGKENQFSADQIQEIVSGFQKIHPQGGDPKKHEEETAKNKKEGEEFLAANAKKDSVKITASGLQYKILREGTGKSPVDSNSVTVQYRGRLVNGTVFDESYKTGSPATFKLTQVIRGWTEGLKLLKEGGKCELYIPSNLAWGDQKAGELIPSGSTVIFEVELISVQ